MKDPTTKFDISRDYIPPNNDWEKVGLSIGQNTNLKELRLGHLWDYYGGITKEALDPFWRGLAKNASIEKLVLDRYHLFGGTRFFTIMCPFFEQNENLRILEIYSITNDIDDKGAKALGKCLERSRSLTYLKINSNTKIKKGWGSVFGCLKDGNCRIAYLSLYENRMNDDAAKSLADALTTNTTLKTLDLGKNILIKSAGWGSIFRYLHSSTCSLEELRLHDNRLDSATVATLAASLADNRTLKKLSLKRNNGWISSEWFVAFVFLLKSPNSILEELDLTCVAIDDKAVIALANSLVNNIKLQRLLIGDAYFNMGEEALMALSQLVCNKSSIMGTYHSNHTLQRVTGHLSHYKVQPYLDLNRKNNKSDIQRRKIIMAHFSVHGTAANGGSGHSNIQPFVDMDLGILPYAIEWIAKDIHGFSLLFEFLPVIFSLVGDHWLWLNCS